MKPRNISIAWGMLWGTLPLAGGLFLWEHNLNLGETGDDLVQIALLLIVFGWAVFWYRQAEYARLRSYAERNPGDERVHYQLITTSALHGDSQGVYSIALSSDRTVPKNEMGHKVSSGTLHHPLEDSYHASNN